MAGAIVTLCVVAPVLIGTLTGVFGAGAVLAEHVDPGWRWACFAAPLAIAAVAIGVVLRRRAAQQRANEERLAWEAEQAAQQRARDAQTAARVAAERAAAEAAQRQAEEARRAAALSAAEAARLAAEKTAAEARSAAEAAAEAKRRADAALAQKRARVDNLVAPLLWAIGDNQPVAYAADAPREKYLVKGKETVLWACRLNIVDGRGQFEPGLLVVTEKRVAFDFENTQRADWSKTWASVTRVHNPARGELVLEMTSGPPKHFRLPAEPEAEPWRDPRVAVAIINRARGVR